MAAAKIAGVKEIYKCGGAQAIASLAYGTESIPKVDKIVGPGNIFVALAKRAVYGYVSIDSIAGPSEILILADETANPRFVAADLLSQCEHDEMASGILITTSKELADNVVKEVDGFVAVAPRKAILEKSLDNYGYILLADNMNDAIDALNDLHCVVDGIDGNKNICHILVIHLEDIRSIEAKIILIFLILQVEVVGHLVFECNTEIFTLGQKTLFLQLFHYLVNHLHIIQVL